MKIKDVEKMSDAKLRFMVAKLAGLSVMEEKFDLMEMWDGESVSMDAAMDGRGVPDYPRSLEAMNQAEKAMDEAGLNGFDTVLWNMCNGAAGRCGAIHATARQRAEAFVLAMAK